MQSSIGEDEGLRGETAAARSHRCASLHGVMGEAETQTPHFAHAADHATDGVRKFCDDAHIFCLCAQPRHSSSGSASRALLLAETNKRRAQNLAFSGLLFFKTGKRSHTLSKLSQPYLATLASYILQHATQQKTL